MLSLTFVKFFQLRKIAAYFCCMWHKKEHNATINSSVFALDATLEPAHRSTPFGESPPSATIVICKHNGIGA